MKLNLFDKLFLFTETEESPKHVGGLQVFREPKEYEGNFVYDLYQTLLQHKFPLPPFNQVIKYSLLGQPYFETEKNLDFEYHIRHVSLPRPGNHKQFMDYVERVHANLLDRSRPLWEVYLIEGLESGEFAIFYKFHHVYADGITLEKWVRNALSVDSGDKKIYPIWSQKELSNRRQEEGVAEFISAIPRTVESGISSGKNFYLLMLNMFRQMLHLSPKTLVFPYDAPRSMFNGHISKARCVAITSEPLNRLKRMAQASKVSLNEVVLCISDIALCRFLQDRNQLPDKPLVIQMPVSTSAIKAEADYVDQGSHNNFTIVPVRLTTSKKKTPYERLLEIHRICHEVKKDVEAYTADAFTNYLILHVGMADVCERLGLIDYILPSANGVISNIPGPSQTLYMMGAEMTALYPISTLPPGISLNITVYSYKDRLFFGIIGSRSVIPDINALECYTDAAFAELEASIKLEVGEIHHD